MQKNNIKNILIQALKPNRFSVMIGKIFKRFNDKQGMHSSNENLSWIESHSCEFQQLAMKLDMELWQEAECFSQKMQINSEEKLKNINYPLGGGGLYPLLYFITRYVKPSSILETGVAAGWSSCAFLEAIKINGKGKLYSSDFPYFRLPNPEKYIGILVDESLKSNWDLYIDGDEKNIPIILNKLDAIDMFHYDSDKSYSGREMVMFAIQTKLSQNSIILMDDIQDNSFFYDYIESNNIQEWYVFEFQGKYVGMIGSLH